MMQKSKISLIASLLPLLSPGAYAGMSTPEISMGGYARSQFYGGKNSSGTVPGVPNSAPSLGQSAGYGLGQAGEISFNVAGETVNGLEYGYLINLDAESGLVGGNAAIGENRLQFANKFGTVQGGNTDGVATYLMVGSLNVLGATGGFGGDYKNIFVVPAGVYAGTNMVGGSGTGTKVSYFSPRISGFQAGVSLTPNTSALGKTMADGNFLEKNTARSSSNVEVALNYAYAWKEMGISLAVANITGRARGSVTTSSGPSSFKNVNSFQAGALLTFGRWLAAVSYTDNGKSLVPVTYANAGADAGKAYNGSVGYNIGPYKVAVGYQRSVAKIARGQSKGRGDVLSFTTDYKVAPGLGIYAEVDSIDMKTNATAVSWAATPIGTKDKFSNHATVFITGVKISF